MKKLVLILMVVTFAFSCKEEKASEPKPEKEPLIMVEQSEMALLMNEMFAFNESIKQQVLKGELTNSYPQHFDKIHSAVLTDPSVRDADFETKSNLFIDAEKAIFEGTPDDTKARYNNAINACISCHNETCVGPIPRIKKLLLK